MNAHRDPEPDDEDERPPACTWIDLAGQAADVTRYGTITILKPPPEYL